MRHHGLRGTCDATEHQSFNAPGNGAARINAAPRLKHGGLIVDPLAFAARYRGKLLNLRPNEFRLLAFFVANPDRVFSRTALIESLGKDSGLLDERTVDVWIGRLRRALNEQGAADPLRTVRSLGYVLDSVEG